MKYRVLTSTKNVGQYAEQSVARTPMTTTKGRRLIATLCCTTSGGHSDARALLRGMLNGYEGPGRIVRWSHQGHHWTARCWELPSRAAELEDAAKAHEAAGRHPAAMIVRATAKAEAQK